MPYLLVESNSTLSKENPSEVLIKSWTSLARSMVGSWTKGALVIPSLEMELETPPDICINQNPSLLQCREMYSHTITESISTQRGSIDIYDTYGYSSAPSVSTGNQAALGSCHGNCVFTTIKKEGSCNSHRYWHVSNHILSTGSVHQWIVVVSITNQDCWTHDLLYLIYVMVETYWF